MRRYHRWLSVIFGLFILWIAVTGVLSQIGSLVNNGGFEAETADRGKRQAAAIGQAVVTPARAHEHDDDDAPRPVVRPAAATPGTATPGVAAAAPFACPADMTCRPKHTPKPGDWNIGFLHHIHSGEQFGPVGVVLSILSGLGLIFFAVSGMWMYLQMFRRRGDRPGQARWFW